MQTSTGTTSFLEAMGGKLPVGVPAGKTVTENGAVSLETTGMARVNLFFKLCRGVEEEQLCALLEAAWAEEPLDCLKLIFNGRDCRGGKGERRIFLLAMNFSKIWSPKASRTTLLDSVKAMASSRLPGSDSIPASIRRCMFISKISSSTGSGNS